MLLPVGQSLDMSGMSHLLIVFVIRLVTCVIRKDRFVSKEAWMQGLGLCTLVTNRGLIEWIVTRAVVGIDDRMYMALSRPSIPLCNDFSLLENRVHSATSALK